SRLAISVWYGKPSASARVWMASRSLLDSRMFSRRSFLNVAFAWREKRARSCLPPPADFHSPRSTDSSNSFSSASIFMVGLLTEVLLRGLPARDDRLQEYRVLVLDERHQIDIVLALDDEDALAG